LTLILGAPDTKIDQSDVSPVPGEHQSALSPLSQCLLIKTSFPQWSPRPLTLPSSTTSPRSPQLNDNDADVEWTKFFLSELFTPYSPFDPYFANHGFDGEVGEGKGKGRDIGNDNEGFCINNISVAVSMTSLFLNQRSTKLPSDLSFRHHLEMQPCDRDNSTIDAALLVPQRR
jgi:hypothetical protein